MIARRLMDASWVQVKSSRHVHCKAAQILEVAPLNISSKSWGRCQGRHVITAHGGGPNVIAAVEATSQAEASTLVVPEHAIPASTVTHTLCTTTREAEI